MPRTNWFPVAPRRTAKARLRVETLEAKVVPAAAPTDFVGPVAGKVRPDGPPRVTPPADMPGLADLDVTIAAAVRNAWRVPVGTATDRWVVQLPAGQSPASLQGIGGTAVRQVSFWANTYEFAFAAPQDVAGFPAVVGDATSPGFYYPVVERVLSKKFAPNDTIYPGQWHLNNTGQQGGTPGEDANLEAAWDILGPDGQPVRGNGVVIGIVDDGLQYTHPDLAPNYSAAHSFDFNDNDPDPAPDPTFDHHGTAVGGVASARGNNGLGVSGTSMEATLTGLRLIAGPFGDPEEAAALGYHADDIDIYNNSWGPPDNGVLGPIGPEALAALAAGYTTGRGGLGNIFTWAAGNGLQSNDNVNYDAYANSRYTIAVGAVDLDGFQAWYSEPGAPMLVTAPSNGDVVGITTTDIVGSNGYNGLPDQNYTNDFGGTSSATPLVSGVIALMLDANPALTARDVQNILVRTARQNDAGDPGWVNNAAGFHVNHKYGFGVIDAAAAVAMAKTWALVAAQVTFTEGPVVVNTPLIDNDPTGVTSSTVVGQNIRLEHVEVVVNIPHEYRGDLRVVLTAPSGVQSVLATTHGDGNPDYIDWVFSTVRHWGESSLGTWTLKVSDEAGVDLGTFQDWTLRFHGTTFGDPPALAGIEAGPVTYVAGQGTAPVTGTLTVSDPDDTTLAGATVTISANYNPAQDFLRFTNTASITGAFAAGTLVLNGTATLAQYQAALRSVQYENTAGSPTAATRTISFRVADPDGLVSNIRSRDVAITLINKVPTLNAIPNPPAVNEDPGLQTINLSGITAGAGETQALTVTATSDNPAVIPNPTVNYTSPATTGTLSYTPVAHQSGTAVITVRVRDNGGTAGGGVDEVTRTFTVTVNSSNDAPAFTPGPDVYVGLNAGPQTFAGWATGISAGPPNETGQTVHFDVTNDANALFAVQPTIAPDGTLTYTPATGAVGPATVSVTLVDNGGTANAGDDTSATVTFTIEIDINDAPIVDDSVVTRLTAVPKYRSAPAGDPVTILAGTITDPDSNQAEGIAVVGLTGTGVGAWQYSTDGGANWAAFGAVSPAAARLVGEDDLIRFVPSGGSAGSPEFTYHAWDEFTGAAGDVVDLTAAGATGGQTAFSVDSARARLRVAPAMTAVAEDNTKAKGDKIATLLTGLAGDVDLKAKKGMAVTGFSATTAGTWQYSAGSKWLAFPAVSLTNALLLSDKDKVRFLPAPEQSGEASIQYRAWDQTVGTKGAKVNLSGPGATGGGSPFSATEDLYFVQVLAANDRPVPDKAYQPAFTPVANGATNPAGDTVAALVGGSITDADGDAVGIAVVGAKSPGGVWQYRLNGAGAWSALTAATPKLAVPLQPDDEVRFLPNVGFLGSTKLTYRGWDQTLGAAGTPVDATKAAAFSTTVHTATVSVGGAVITNSSPHLDTAATPVLTPVLEDTAGFGDPVTTILGGAFSDPDAGASSGIAVVGLTGTADGQWQYSTTGGKKWLPMGTVSEARALLLRDTDRVRFLPNRDFTETRELTFRAWDQTEGSAGQYADLTLPGTTGGAGAVSPESDTAAATVLPVNDSPGFTTTAPARFSPQAKGNSNPPGDSVAALLGPTLTDPDVGDPQGIAVVKVDTAPGGTWQFRVSPAGTWQSLPTTVEVGFALALHADAEIRFLADAAFEGTRSLSFVAWDHASWQEGNQVPAIGLGFSKAVRTAILTVTSGNVRPILDPKGVKPLTSVMPDAASPPGDLVSALLANAIVDPDGADPQGIAVSLADAKNGRWEFSTNAGASWQTVTGVSKKTALLLRATDMIRFVPTAGYRGTAKLTYQAWDQFTGTAGQKVDASLKTGTAFSSASATSLVKVNTAPTLDG